MKRGEAMPRYKPRYNLPHQPDADRRRQKETQRIASIGQEVSAPLRDLSDQLISLVDAIKSNNKKTDRSEEKRYKKGLFWTRFSGVSSIILSFYSLIVLALYTGLTYGLLKVGQDSFHATQRSYVTIGRKDGVVAEFVMPKDSKDNAGIVMYFQNNGHIPAKFNWGIGGDIVVIPPLPDFATVKSPHHFIPMTRTRNRKDGSTGEGQGAGGTIASDSMYIADVVELPQERVVQLSHMDRLFMIDGVFEYCDALGTYSCRQFQMFYQGVPYDSFRLAFDSECPVFLRVPPPPSPDIEYLPVCQTVDEEEAKHQKEEAQFRKIYSR